MAGNTSIPAAINGAYDLVVSALSVAKPDVTVYYGPMPVTDPPRTFVVVGYSEDEDQTAIQGTTERWGGEGTPAEDYAIACYVSTWDGDSDDLRTKLTDTAAVYDVITAAVRADRTLKGAIQPPGLAEIGTFSWVMDQLEDGAVVQVAFDIHVTSAVLW
jgi:hypothetical protein